MKFSGGQTPDDADATRLRHLERQCQVLERDRDSARLAGRWSAVAALARELRAVEDALHAEKVRQATAESAARPLTDEERAARLVEIASTSPDEDLEVFVREWLSRNHHSLEVDAEGVLHLVRESTRLYRVQ